MKPEVKARLQHIGLIAGCFVASIFITGASCPFAGPSTPDALFFMLGLVLASHVVATVISLFIPKVSWISVVVLGLICFAPAIIFAGYAIKEHLT